MLLTKGELEKKTCKSRLIRLKISPDLQVSDIFWYVPLVRGWTMQT